MIPFQTILALIAVLVAISGCAQRLPPIPGGRSSSAVATGSASPSPSPVTNQPSVTQVTNVADVTISNASGHDYELHLRGEDATKISKMLAIKAIDNAKTGKQIKCTRDAKATSSPDECVIKILTADGSIPDLISADQVQKADAELVVTDNFVDTNGYLLLNKEQDSDSDKTYAFRISVWPKELAKQIFDGLTVKQNVKNSISRKSGANIACDYDESDAKNSYYVCRLYLHIDTGRFELTNQ